MLSIAAGEGGRRFRAALAAAADEQPGAESLGQQEQVAGPRPALAQDPVGVDRPDHRQAVLRLRVADRVAAREDAAGLAHLRRGSLEDRREASRGSSSGNAAIDSAKRTRPPIANMSRQRIGRGDRAVGLRVVHERREEVDRADDRDLVADAVDGGVVGG